MHIVFPYIIRSSCVCVGGGGGGVHFLNEKTGNFMPLERGRCTHLITKIESKIQTQRNIHFLSNHTVVVKIS